ncbi:MAG: hypothetical protein RLZZ175_1605 [Bacteroidota bacterium]|jgi:glycosyltransferase involved in cell wall biosynthesis
MKKAFVLDWLDKYGGAERVIASLEAVFKFDKTYTLINIMKRNDLEKIYKTNQQPITETWLKFFKSKFRALFFVFHYLINKIKIDEDIQLIISSSHAIAKGVNKSSKNQLHICYFQARNFKYIWDDFELYFGKTSFLFKPLVSYLRKVDIEQAKRPDYIIANSKFVQKWIKQTYNRDSDLIYPPVDLAKFTFEDKKNDYFVAVGRIVAYKRFDLIVKAFNELGLPIIIIGDGAQLSELKEIAKPNITFTGFLNSEEINNYISKAKGFIHSGVEDFGIAPIEAQACGTPVIAYEEGGVLETVINNETGIYFKEQTPESIINAIHLFNNLQFNYEKVRENALNFSKERFETEFLNYVKTKCKKHNIE